MTTTTSQYNIDETTAQINKLISQSSDALLCGPDCQKIRKTELLKQTYLDAQANVETAPNQLEEAAKNYYTYTEGDAGYNNLRKKELTQQADKMVALSTDKFQTEIDNATDLTTTYNSLHITYQNMEELYKKYLEENKRLRKRLVGSRSDTITNDRKSFYESQGYDVLTSWYILLKWLYISLVIVYIMGLFMSPSSYSITIRICILIALMIYPFVIQPIFSFFHTLFQRLYSYLPKNAYTTLQ
jgi:hypothetical protein